MTTALTRQQQNDLRSCEQVISKGINTFREVGQALARIRDDRLYKATHKTFEGYCNERWGFNRAHAYRLIAASDAPEMSPTGDKIENERQARDLRQQQRQAEQQDIDDDPDEDDAADDVERIPHDTAGEPRSSTVAGSEPAPAVSSDFDDSPASDAAILKPQPPAAADRGGASSQFDWWTERLGWLADKWRAQFGDKCDTKACVSANRNFVKTIGW